MIEITRKCSRHLCSLIFHKYNPSVWLTSRKTYLLKSPQAVGPAYGVKAKSRRSVRFTKPV